MGHNQGEHFTVRPIEGARLNQEAQANLDAIANFALSDSNVQTNLLIVKVAFMIVTICVPIMGGGFAVYVAISEQAWLWIIPAFILGMMIASPVALIGAFGWLMVWNAEKNINRQKMLQKQTQQQARH